MNPTEKFLQQKGVKPTSVRLLVLNEFMRSSEAKTLADIENSLDTADRTTIYRTLKTFVEKGVLHPIELASEAVKYALCSANCEQEIHTHIHPHFVCTGCGETVCLEVAYFKLQGVPESYQVQDAELLLKGLCPKCN